MASITGWYALRSRLNQAVTRTRIRAEERERIARDLHDTLLQSIQGLLLTLQAISRQPMGEETREALVHAVAVARRAVAESRDKLSALRAGDAPSTCPMVILLEELAAEAASTGKGTEVVLEGRARELAWEVTEEVVAVLREALANARKHARATRIALVVSFEKRHLVARVEDDGVGIGAHVLRRGVREGHFGLVGMRERARRIRARLQVQSAPGQGTSVTLKVPASRAYARA
jgi:signal transduction histidine kinase